MSTIPLLAAASRTSAPPPPPPPPQASSVNYLNRYVEFIKPDTASWFRFAGNAFFIASKVTLVAFATLAAVALIFTGVTSSASLPFTSLAIMLLTPATWKVSEGLQEKADKLFENAERSKSIKAIYDALPANKAALEAKLAEIGVTPDQINDLEIRADVSQLHPILAHYLYWRETTQKMENAAEIANQEAQKHQIDYPNETVVIEEKRLVSMSAKEQALVSKVQASFNYGLLLHPKFSREEEDVITFEPLVNCQYETAATNKLVLGQRALAARFNDPKAQEFLTITKGNVKSPVTFDEATTQMIPQLSSRIFA